MIRNIIGIFFFNSIVVFSQISPQSKKITQKYFQDPDIVIKTPGILKKKGYTNYEDLINFLDKYQKSNPSFFKYNFIGESQKGKKVPLIDISNNSKKRKVKVWIQGGLHGDEPASTECILYFIDQLMTNNLFLLENIHFQIIPMANIDGYLKFDRYAANGLDLNRDQTKLEIKESLFLKASFSKFSPHVALDMHEYTSYRRDFVNFGSFGVTNPNDVMFLYSGNLNVPKEIRNMTENIFVKNAKKKLEELNYRSHDYFSSTKVKNEIQFKQGSIHSRSSATSYALSNCIASLIEIRGKQIGKTSFKRRIKSGYTVIMSYVNDTYDNYYKLLEFFDVQNDIIGDSVVVVSSPKNIVQNIDMIDVASTDMIKINVKTMNALESSPKLSRKSPTAYLIKKNNFEIIQKLKILGLKIDSLSKSQELNVESFKVIKYDKKDFKYEGADIQTVNTILNPEIKQFNKGDYIIYTDQKKINLAVEVLEPEALNSFVYFSIIKTNLNQIIPIYRYYEKNKLF